MPGTTENTSPVASRPQGPVATLPPESCHVGSSEAAALFNLSPHLTRFELYLRKRGELPERQLQHQLACTGRLWGALGILIGGNELRVLPYERHEGAIRRIEREVPIFWSEVLEGRPPKPSYEADLRTLTTLYRHAARGSFLDLRGNDRARELCAAYLAANAAERAARARREIAKAELLELIGHAETV